MNYFVTAIGTDCGKTVASAILTEALAADYWKPVQAGRPSDTDSVKKLVSNDRSRFHPEAYLLKSPMSPHAAAEIDGIEIHLSEIKLPETPNTLIIEGAGGIMVPLNDTELVIDMAARFNSPVILVIDYYLGSINHSLLSLKVLREKGLPVAGLIFNGKKNKASQEIILKHFPYPLLLEIDREEEVTPAVIKKYANQLKQHLP